MTEVSKILGVILAGGAATRMFPHPQGGDKGLADLGGEPLLAHVIARVRPQVQHLILNANGDAARFQSFGLDVVADDPQCPARGPLAGLVTAMHYAERSGHHFEAIATVTTDCPFVPHDLIQRLLTRFQSAPVLAASAGSRHPAIGLWPVLARDAVQMAADSGDWSLGRLVDQLNGIAVDFPLCKVDKESIDPFFNANTEDDLARARMFLSAKG